MPAKYFKFLSRKVLYFKYYQVFISSITLTLCFLGTHKKWYNCYENVLMKTTTLQIQSNYISWTLKGNKFLPQFWLKNSLKSWSMSLFNYRPHFDIPWYSIQGSTRETELVEEVSISKFIFTITYLHICTYIYVYMHICRCTYNYMYIQIHTLAFEYYN